jgi:hypothetical protein
MLISSTDRSMLLFSHNCLMLLQLEKPLALLPGPVSAWRLVCMLPDQLPAMHLVRVST